MQKNYIRNLGKFAEKGVIPWNKGKHHSKETKEKISVTKKKQVDREFLKRISLLGILKQQNSKEPTSLEKIVYEYLSLRGIKFEKQKLINGKFLVDAYIPSTNTIIEVDGFYWHSLEKVMKKDKAENAYLLKCGYNLVRLSEEEVKSNIFTERMVV